MKEYITKRYIEFRDDFAQGYDAYLHQNYKVACRNLRPALERLASIVLCDLYNEATTRELYEGSQVFDRDRVKNYVLVKRSSTPKQASYKLILMHQAIISRLPEGVDAIIRDMFNTVNTVLLNFYNTASENAHESDIHFDAKLQVDALFVYLRCFMNALSVCDFPSEASKELFAELDERLHVMILPLQMVVAQAETPAEPAPAEAPEEAEQPAEAPEQPAADEPAEPAQEAESEADEAEGDDKEGKASASDRLYRTMSETNRFTILGKMTLDELSRVYKPRPLYKKPEAAEAVSVKNEEPLLDATHRRGIYHEPRYGQSAVIEDEQTGFEYFVLPGSTDEEFYDDDQVSFELKGVPNRKHPDKVYYVPVNIQLID